MTATVAGEEDTLHHCRRCYGPILWAQRYPGDWVALDPTPLPRGLYARLPDDSEGKPRAVKLPPEEWDLDDPTIQRYREHASTCGAGPSTRSAAYVARRMFDLPTRLSEVQAAQVRAGRRSTRGPATPPR